MEKPQQDNSPLTLGIFAHANAGKTTLTEDLLYHTGTIDSIGRVDEGNTVTDFLSVEQQRGITVRAALVTFDLDGRKIQLIDTPGHIDFSAEVERALQVLDCAVVVISGVEGVEPQTYTLWKHLKQKKVPTIIFINKMDRMGADYEKTIEEIKTKLEKRVISLISSSGDDSSPKNFTPKPAGIQEIADQIANFDDEMLETCIDSPGLVTHDFVETKLRDLIGQAQAFPVLGGSALKNEGIENLIECLKKYIPTPPQAPNGKFSAFIYMVRVDEGRKDLYTKIISGKTRPREKVKTGEDSQQIKSLRKVEGNTPISIEEAKSGEIVIINGVDTSCGNYIGQIPEEATQIQFVNPLITMNITAKKEDQKHDLVKALKTLNEEDPYLSVRHDRETGEESVSLMGEIQAQILQTMLLERFGIETELSKPLLIHKETPTKVGVGIATYTKVSAVKLEVKPLPPGSGLVYQSKLSTDFLLQKYQRQTERLVREYIRQGVFGWEITDAEISLVDGRFDSMGSDPLHFNIAVPLALIRALKQAEMRILEPISRYTVIFPKEFLSEVIKTLTGFNGTFEITRDDSEEITIEGEARHRYMLDFSQILLGVTGGRGTHSNYLCRYEPSNDQKISKDYNGNDPRNETVFVINEMGGSLDALDKPFTKRKKESRSKHKRQQKEKLYAAKKGKL